MISALIVEIIVAIIVVPTISVGASESYCIRIAMTVVGTSVNPDVFIAKKVIMDRVAYSDSLLNSFICCIAFNPIGVAAFPRPNMLAVMLERIYPIAGCSLGNSGKILMTIGLNSLTSNCRIPASLVTFMITSQKNKTLIIPIDKVTASFALSKIASFTWFIVPLNIA